MKINDPSRVRLVGETVRTGDNERRRGRFFHPWRRSSSRRACADAGRSVEDLDDAARPGIDQYRMAIKDGVAVSGSPVLGGNIVIRDVFIRQNRADPEFASVCVRRPSLAHDVFVEARALLDSQNSADGAGHGTYGPTEHLSDWAACPGS